MSKKRMRYSREAIKEIDKISKMFAKDLKDVSEKRAHARRSDEATVPDVQEAARILRVPPNPIKRILFNLLQLLGAALVGGGVPELFRIHTSIELYLVSISLIIIGLLLVMVGLVNEVLERYI